MILKHVKEKMESTFEIVLSLVISAVLLVYLVYTLIKPDKF